MKELIFIDELDAGVLEMLGKESLYFTTTNVNNRYEKFNSSEVKNTSNLRKMYIRAILLDYDGKYYDSADKYDIERSFRNVSI